MGFEPDEPFTAPDGTPLQGYVWHCHMLDHEDNVMMHRIRIIKASADASAPTVPGMSMMPGHEHH